jgi:hypothetical protein
MNAAGSRLRCGAAWRCRTAESPHAESVMQSTRALHGAVQTASCSHPCAAALARLYARWIGSVTEHTTEHSAVPCVPHLVGRQLAGSEDCVCSQHAGSVLRPCQTASPRTARDRQGSSSDASVSPTCHDYHSRQHQIGAGRESRSQLRLRTATASRTRLMPLTAARSMITPRK